MKKNYIEPRITVMTCSSEHIMMLTGSTTRTLNFHGYDTVGPCYSLEPERPEEPGSKSNSGLLDWDDEEEW